MKAQPVIQSRFREGWHTFVTVHVLVQTPHGLRVRTRKVEESGGWRGALCLVERVCHYLVTGGNRKSWPLDSFINGRRTGEAFWRLRTLLLYGKV